MTMGYLRLTLIIVSSVVVAGLLKLLFAAIFPLAIVFIYNLTAAVQVSLMLWLIIHLSLQAFAPKNIYRKTGLVLLAALTLPELLFTYWLHHPAKIPAALEATVQQYYNGVQRNIIQFNPACSRYDQDLLYTLKPSSTFLFSDYEFSDSFYTNRYGLRDDEASLNAPEIICIGDSYTMGWGVEQQETFAEQISSISGKKVLNAGVSSYGTAREMKNLTRLDASNLQYLVIQYCQNDREENEQFVDSGYTLKISSADKYRSSVKEHSWSKLWFPAKHAITISKSYLSDKLSEFPRKKKSADTKINEDKLHQSASLFLDILKQSPVDFNKTKVLVIDLNEKRQMNNEFVDELNSMKETTPYREHFKNNLVCIPTADLLNDEDFYILDPHIRPSGHKKIAGLLSKYILSKN